MKIKYPVVVEKDVDAIRMVVPVRYGTEDIPEKFPGREGDTLTLTLDLDKCAVRDWPSDHGSAELAMKVCDQGCYYLLAGDVVIAKVEDYVPGCIPNDFGDYIALEIAENGVVTNWSPLAEEIQESFFPRDDE